MNHHGNKQRKSGVTACTTVQQVRLQPPPVASSLAIRHWGGGWPPALLSGGNGNGGIGPFGTGGDTHTLSLSQNASRSPRPLLGFEDGIFSSCTGWAGFGGLPRK